jgi:HK97 family phage major capsid protein
MSAKPDLVEVEAEEVSRFLENQQKSFEASAEQARAIGSLCSSMKEQMEQHREFMESQAKWMKETFIQLRRSEERGRKPGEAYAAIVAEFANQISTKGPNDAVSRTISSLRDSKTLDRSESALIERAMEVQRPENGGIVVPAEFMDEIIPFFRFTASILKMGVRMISIGEGKTYIPRLESGTAGTWEIENSLITESNTPKYGALEMIPKKHAVRLHMSREWVRATKGAGAGQIAASDTAGAFNQEWGRVAFNGDGQKEPKGLFKYGSLIPRFTGTQSALKVDTRAFWAFFKKAFRQANKGNINDGLAWVFNEDVSCLLEAAENGFGLSKFSTFTEKSEMLRIPCFEDFQLETFGTSGSPTQMAIGAFSEFLIGTSRGLELMYSEHSRMAYDQFELLAIWCGDMGPRQLNAFTVCETGKTED